MKGIILAAGRGSRMKEMTDDRPKCLVHLEGKSLLDWQVESLKQAGVSTIGIVTGYKRELLVGRGLVEFHNPRWAETNMVSSLVCAEQWLNAEPCIISYSDIVYSASAVSSLVECSADLAVTYDPNWLSLWTERFDDPLSDAETFRLSGSGTVTEIGGKPLDLSQVQGQYMGLLRFTPRGWVELSHVRARLPPGQRDAIHMTGILQKVVDAGSVSILAVPYTGGWYEVDSAADLVAYQRWRGGIHS